jgi:hypothetical protein
MDREKKPGFQGSVDLHGRFRHHNSPDPSAQRQQFVCICLLDRKNGLERNMLIDPAGPLDAP